MSSLLEMQGVSASYGTIQALFGVDLDVGEAEVVALFNQESPHLLGEAVDGIVRLRARRSENRHRRAKISERSEPFNELCLDPHDTPWILPRPRRSHLGSEERGIRRSIWNLLATKERWTAMMETRL